MKDRSCSGPTCCVPVSANVSQPGFAVPSAPRPPALRVHSPDSLATATKARPSGAWSTTRTSRASAGPSLRTVMRYDTSVPGTTRGTGSKEAAGVHAPSDCTTRVFQSVRLVRSSGENAASSVSFAGSGSTVAPARTAAVFTISPPVHAASTTPVSARSGSSPTCRDAPVYVQVIVSPARAAPQPPAFEKLARHRSVDGSCARAEMPSGRVSVTVIGCAWVLRAVDGPRLRGSRFHVTAAPAVMSSGAETTRFASARSASMATSMRSAARSFSGLLSFGPSTSATFSMPEPGARSASIDAVKVTTTVCPGASVRPAVVSAQVSVPPETAGSTGTASPPAIATEAEPAT